MGYSESENGEFVRLPSQGATGGHHVTQFIDIHCHFAPPPPLNLTVTLSATVEATTGKVTTGRPKHKPQLWGHTELSTLTTWSESDQSSL